MNMKRCRTCKEVKELDDYPMARRNLDGRNNQCRVCLAEYGKQYRKGNRLRDKNVKDIDSLHINIKGVRRSEWCKMYNALEELGYDVTDDIHRQFVEKHNLTYKSRPTRNEVHFTRQDCLDRPY